MNQVIKTVFSEMVDEIQETKTQEIEPNRYHGGAAVSEVNLVYHFCKQLEKKSSKCAVYLEFPCDSGRVDAVVLYENNILLIEAKSNLDNKKHKILNAQACRFENTRNHLKLNSDDNYDTYLKDYLDDYSLRDTLKERVHNFMENKFKIKDTINIYGVLISTAKNEYMKNKWDYNHNSKHFQDYTLSCINDNYTMIDAIEKYSVWYLGAYKHIGILD